MTSPHWQCPGCGQWVTTTEAEHVCTDAYSADRATAWKCADDCDTCWFFLTDTAFDQMGDEVIAVKLRNHLAANHMLTSEEC